MRGEAAATRPRLQKCRVLFVARFGRGESARAQAVGILGGEAEERDAFAGEGHVHVVAERFERDEALNGQFARFALDDVVAEAQRERDLAERDGVAFAEEEHDAAGDAVAGDVSRHGDASGVRPFLGCAGGAETYKCVDAPRGAMGALADRLAFLLREWGSDASARQAELHALSALEEADAKAAVERFHELKRAYALQRRSDLLRELRAHAFATDVPPEDATGMSQRDVEREMRFAEASVRHARAARAAMNEATKAADALALRRAPEPPALDGARWDDLRAVAERAEAHRRAVAREARVESRAAEAARRARRLRERPVDIPDVATETVPDAERAAALLDAAEAALAAAEAVEDAHRSVSAGLRDPAMREFRNRSRKEVEREAAGLLRMEDAVEAARGLRALLPRIEALRVEAARDASEAARARRSGRPPPRGESRPGDGMDPYA